jgi:protein subunit release factor B
MYHPYFTYPINNPTTQNKTSSAVQLKHLPTGLVLKVQSTRSRTQNRNLAREMLASRIDELEKGPASRAAVVRDIKSKRKASSAKKSRRKYARLEAEKKAAANGTSAEGSAEGNGEEVMSSKDGRDV